MAHSKVWCRVEEPEESEVECWVGADFKIWCTVEEPADVGVVRVVADLFVR